MIIEFIKKQNFYDDLTKELYGCEINKTIYNNFIPIIINNEHFILTSSKNLEGYLIDYKDDINVKIYITNNVDVDEDVDEDEDEDEDVDMDNNIECIELKLNNIVIFGTSINYQTNCYIDTINNLLLIKFNSSKLNYIQIDNNLDCENDLRFDIEKIKLKYVWVDENFNERTLNKFSKIINTWEDKYINLPPIPYMIDVKKQENIECDSMSQTNPITGSAVYDFNDNLLGIVSYVNIGEIIITPLICIKKMNDYLKEGKLLYLGLDIFPIKLDFKSGLNNVNYSNGLLVINNYYDDIIEKKKKLEKKIRKLQNDNDNNNNNNNNGDYTLNLEQINESLNNSNIVDINQENDNSVKCVDQKQLKNIIILNTLLEQYKLIEYIECDKSLKKGNIICSIDNYKINSNGSIIINMVTNQKTNKTKFKTIPFKSYIWLFKNSFNNRLILNNILPNNYRGDLTKIILKNNEILINDSHIKKQINLHQSNIILKSDYNLISSLGYNDLKYITYNSIKLIELNEKILEIIKKYISNNQLKYSLIIEKIFNNKYTYENKKILLILNFEKKIPKIKFVSNNIKNF